MVKLYLWVNSALYLLVALWNTFRKELASQISGYLSLDSSGWSEYLTEYGGLQLGMAGFFAYLASQSEYHKVGIVFALLIYMATVVYRLVGMYILWPVRHVTWAIATMEVVLLLTALLMFVLLPKQST